MAEACNTVGRTLRSLTVTARPAMAESADEGAGGGLETMREHLDTAFAQASSVWEKLKAKQSELTEREEKLASAEEALSVRERRFEEERYPPPPLSLFL